MHLEDFKFAELKWAKSSRMSKRWLVFTCRIQARPPPCLLSVLSGRLHDADAACLVGASSPVFNRSAAM